MWDKEMLPSGMNILIKDSASLVPDKNIHPSISHMDTHDAFYCPVSQEVWHAKERVRSLLEGHKCMSCIGLNLQPFTGNGDSPHE